MRHLNYSQKYTVRFMYPREWETTTAVDLTLRGEDGVDIGTPITCDILDDEVLDADVETGDNVIVLDTGDLCDPLILGMPIRIGASEDGPEEYLTVTTFNATADTLTLQRSCVDAHTDGAVVSPRFCSVELDLTDTAVFTNLRRLTLVWTPDEGIAVNEPARVQKYGAVFDGFEEQFKLLHPTAYTLLAEHGRWSAVYDAAVSRFTNALAAQGRDLEMLQDRALVTPALQELVLWYASRIRGTDGNDDVDRAWKAYEVELEVLRTIPLRIDAKQDDKITSDKQLPAHDWLPLVRNF